jgi:hypothetical protein
LADLYCLQADGEDELKKRQLMELAIINGTYRDSSIKAVATAAGTQFATCIGCTFDFLYAILIQFYAQYLLQYSCTVKTLRYMSYE